MSCDITHIYEPISIELSMSTGLTGFDRVHESASSAILLQTLKDFKFKKDVQKNKKSKKVLTIKRSDLIQGCRSIFCFASTFKKNGDDIYMRYEILVERHKFR